MRPGVRTATLDGYLGLARSVGLDPARILTNAGIAVADLAVPDKWVPAAVVSRVLERSADRVGTRGLRPAAGRPAPAGDARPAQRRAEPGARPAQRPDAAVPVRAQLQRGAADAAGRGRGPGHDAAVVRVRRAGADPAGDWSWPPPRCSASSASCSAGSGSRCRSASPTGRRPRSTRTARRSGPGCSSGTSSPGWSSTPPSSTPRTRRPTRCCGPTPSSCSSALGAPPAATVTGQVTQLVEMLLPVGRCSTAPGRPQPRA